MTSAIIAGIPASTPIARQTLYTHFNRKLVQGVGINDHSSQTRIAGQAIKSYAAWSGMLTRCYSANCQTRQPTYAGCSVSKEWHYFSVFERWYTENYFEGAQLDKDILYQGNRVYSPDTCVFVTPELNRLLVLGKAAKDKSIYLVGVRPSRRRFVAQITDSVSQRHLGSFATPLEAHRAWQLAKALIIENFPTNNPRIRAALDLRVAQLRDDYANNRITTKL